MLNGSNQRRRNMRGWVLLGALVGALALLTGPATSFAAAPAARLQAATHRPNTTLKTLRSRTGEFKPATSGPVSPYARAAAERNASRQLPGHRPPPSRVSGTSP